mmetsp:Transcript_14022/g.38321  ORF Transcript_14022/g.38321 Transcript_14022/m.38321 type:complete len:517 (-) Transcript_14022:97-1647(-)
MFLVRLANGGEGSFLSSANSCWRRTLAPFQELKREATNCIRDVFRPAETVVPEGGVGAPLQTSCEFSVTPDTIVIVLPTATAICGGVWLSLKDAVGEAITSSLISNMLGLDEDFLGLGVCSVIVSVGWLGYEHAHCKEQSDVKAVCAQLRIVTAFAGTQIATVPFSPKQTVWDLKRELQTISGTSALLQQLCYDREVLSDTRTLADHGVDAGSSIAFAKRKRLLFQSCAFDRSVRLWDGESGVCLSVSHQPDLFAPLAVSADISAMKVLVGYNRGALKLWSLETGEFEQNYAGHSKAILAVHMDWDLRLAVTSGEDMVFLLWDLRTSLIAHRFCGHVAAVVSLVVDWSTRRLATASLDSSIRFWNVSTGRCVQTIVPERDALEIYALSVDWHSHQALFGCNDSIIRHWDVKGKRCLAMFRGHEGSVLALVADWATGRAVSTSGDASIRLWDIQSGVALRTFLGHTSTIWDACVDWDVGVIISASHDGTLRKWKIEDGECECVFSGHTNSVRFVTLL